jgi:hypothetical protein
MAIGGQLNCFGFPIETGSEELEETREAKKGPFHLARGEGNARATHKIRGHR